MHHFLQAVNASIPAAALYSETAELCEAGKLSHILCINAAPNFNLPNCQIELPNCQALQGIPYISEHDFQNYVCIFLFFALLIVAAMHAEIQFLTFSEEAKPFSGFRLHAPFLS